MAVKRPLIVAHRGASKKAPENTLPAFELAWKVGADAIEADFRLTKDGHIVCMHDATTKRTTDKDLAVAESTLEELRKLDAGAAKGDSFKDTPIPTLAEVLATVPSEKKIYIELKSGTETIKPLIQELGRSGLKNEQMLVISFDQDTLKKLKTQAPQYKTSWLVNFRRSKAGKIRPALSAVLDTLSDIKADGLSSSCGSTDAKTIEKLKARGIEHHVWTVDDASTAKRFADMGTASVTTNIPAEVLAAFSDHSPK